MQDESARQRGWWKWKWKDLKSGSLEICKTIINNGAKMIGMSTNLARTAPKWKLANHGLKSRNDEVGIIKRSRGDCMKDQY